VQNGDSKIGDLAVQISGEDAVVIVNQISTGAIRQSLPELLQCPFRCAVGGDVGVEG
jgi:hypothetical protein